MRRAPVPAVAPPLIAAIDALIAAGLREEAARLLARFDPELIRSGQAGAIARLETELGFAGTPGALLLHARVIAE
ncbi:MAG: hypothetical protein IPI73_18245 [Betaproteobacteria bacterium]|nr:hypothetical protein [Betaproteobacteria bacterium]